MHSKEEILEEIRRTAEENGGTPLGRVRFEKETGIARYDWMGKYWARWGDAVDEAGFSPNEKQGIRQDTLAQLAAFAQELGKIPVNNDLRLRRRQDRSFPSHGAFDRFGSKSEMINQLRKYCIESENTKVESICVEYLRKNPLQIDSGESESQGPVGQIGFVYLLKSGKYYKIGKTNSAGRRERELTIQLPEKAKLVHEIKTDDPTGIELYWHRRFQDQRKNGEWFELTQEDIRAFKRRKFM